MHIIRYRQDQVVSYGVLEGEDIRRIEGSIFERHSVIDERLSLSGVELLAPVIPNKLIAIGLNYIKHAEEVNKPLPDEPMMFLVSPTAVIGPNEPIRLKNPAHRTEHEGELAIVIGRHADRVEPEEALDYAFGYTCCNDISDRVLQKKDGQFTRAKSFATYKPLGPVIVTADAFNPDQAPIRVQVNGEIRQNSNTNDMIFSAAAIISFVSGVMALEPGDVIITGTPSGVAPLQAGDTVEVHIDGIGRLVNPVAVN